MDVSIMLSRSWQVICTVKGMAARPATKAIISEVAETTVVPLRKCHPVSTVEGMMVGPVTQTPRFEVSKASVKPLKSKHPFSHIEGLVVGPAIQVLRHRAVETTIKLSRVGSRISSKDCRYQQWVEPYRQPIIKALTAVIQLRNGPHFCPPIR
jgi:hypothetical protein